MRTCRARINLEDKVKSLKELQAIAKKLHLQKKNIVFTNGCFDIIHYGHVKYLQDAKKKGDILVIAINSDASVKRIKGKKRPIIGEKDRARVIAGLLSVDFVVIFNQDTPIEVIKSIKPDILVKGADWDKNKIVGYDFVTGYDGKVCTIKFINGRSTSKIIKKIAKNY